MNKFSSGKDEAWKFMAWVTSKELLQRTVTYENINPTRQSVWNNPETIGATNWGEGEYRRTAELLLSQYARIRWTPSSKVPQIGDRWAEALQEIFSGTKTAKQALDDAAKDIDRIVRN
jgi:multiple sugar transport system substrate-binding protein